MYSQREPGGWSRVARRGTYPLFALNLPSTYHYRRAARRGSWRAPWRTSITWGWRTWTSSPRTCFARSKQAGSAGSGGFSQRQSAPRAASSFCQPSANQPLGPHSSATSAFTFLGILFTTRPSRRAPFSIIQYSLPHRCSGSGTACCASSTTVAPRHSSAAMASIRRAAWVDDHGGTEAYMAPERLQGGGPYPSQHSLFLSKPNPNPNPDPNQGGGPYPSQHSLFPSKPNPNPNPDPNQGGGPYPSQHSLFLSNPNPNPNPDPNQGGGPYPSQHSLFPSKPNPNPNPDPNQGGGPYPSQHSLFLSKPNPNPNPNRAAGPTPASTASSCTSVPTRPVGCSARPRTSSASVRCFDPDPNPNRI
eukprot:scaffold7329_cov58-Phaeocystis_antarctica.AAC.4